MAGCLDDQELETHLATWGIRTIMKSFTIKLTALNYDIECGALIVNTRQKVTPKVRVIVQPEFSVHVLVFGLWLAAWVIRVPKTYPQIEPLNVES